jgi:hypothetical protein
MKHLIQNKVTALIYEIGIVYVLRYKQVRSWLTFLLLQCFDLWEMLQLYLGGTLTNHKMLNLEASETQRGKQSKSLGTVCSYFSASFFSRKTEKLKVGINGKLFN